MSYYVRENVVENYLILEVKKRGGRAYKFVSPGRVNVPDRICIMPGGRVFFVECKAPTKDLRAAQRRELERMKALGAEVFVLNKCDVSEIFPNDNL